MSATHAHRVQVRWRDLDGLGHVNNTVVHTYLEEGRDSFLEEHGIGRTEYVVGRCSIEFLAEIAAEQRWITAECAVSELGRSSITTSERLLDESGAVVVRATVGIVLWDAERRSSRPITDEERAALTGSEE